MGRSGSMVAKRPRLSATSILARTAARSTQDSRVAPHSARKSVADGRRTTDTLAAKGDGLVPIFMLKRHAYARRALVEGLHRYRLSTRIEALLKRCDPRHDLIKF